MSTNIVAHDVHAHHLKTLLVEDNLIIQRLHHEFLRRLGCQVCTATDGTEAVKQASSIKFDVILMDIDLPDMSGIEAAKLIRKQIINRNTRIIALTSQNTTEVRRRALEAGMDGFQTKPASLAILKTLL